MPQMQLPVFYDGVNPITNDVGYEKRVQSRLDQGQSLSEISAELALNYDALRKAVADGRLKKPFKKKKTTALQSPARS